MEKILRFMASNPVSSRMNWGDIDALLRDVKAPMSESAPDNRYSRLESHLNAIALYLCAQCIDICQSILYDDPM
jgi:hypothetical protein